MANSAIISSWGANIAGREQMGLGVFMSGVQYFTELKQKGEIEELRIYVTTQGSVSATNGWMIVEGSAEQIAALTRRDDYQKLIVKAMHVVHGFSTVTGSTGDDVMNRIEIMQAARKELGL
jgi:hypothetical protein